MKAKYTLEVRPGVVLPVPPGTRTLEIGSALVEWLADENGNLTDMVLEFQGLEMELNEAGRIDPAPLELRKKAYRLAIYVANRIYLQTSIDAIDPEQILLGSPAVFPESPDEEVEFKRTPRRVWKTFRGSWSVRARFDPAIYEASHNHSVVYGYCADAMRATSPFQRLELLYKVIEYFFPQNGAALALAVSAHLAPHDSRVSPELIEKITSLRNRIVHPRARGRHAHPERVEDLQEVEVGVKTLHELAGLLLKHPTF